MNFIPGTRNAMRRRLWAVLIGAGMLAAGCGRENQRTAEKIEVVPGLRVQKIQLRGVAVELEAPGSVIAVSTAQVAARTMGTVLQVAVREGDYVKRGQVLAQLDERELASHRSAAQAGAQGATAGVVQTTKALAAAQAQADVMQKTYDRYSYLKEQKSVSPQEFDEISAKQQAAQANLEQVKAALRQAEAGSAQAESEAHAGRERRELRTRRCALRRARNSSHGRTRIVGISRNAAVRRRRCITLSTRSHAAGRSRRLSKEKRIGARAVGCP